MDELIQGVKTLKVKELKAELKARSITINANKDVLAARLIKEIKRDKLEQNYDDQVEDDYVQEEDENINVSSDPDPEVDDVAVNNIVAAEIQSKSSVFTFKDVEESLQRFSGDRKQNLHKWIKDFEETATILKWSDIHKLVYAKRLLTGAAKMFINVEKSVTSYKQLIKCLKDEFGQALSSVKIHKQLMETKKLKAETYREYLYRMMAIAEQANIDIESVIQYVIDGIDDSETNKSVLYGVTKLVDIKKRLDAYEIMKSKLPESQKGTPQGDSKFEYIFKDCFSSTDEKSKNDYTSEADEC